MNAPAVTPAERTDARLREATSALEQVGPLRSLDPERELSTTLDAKGTGKVTFGVQADNATGKAKIKLKTSGLDVVSQEVEIAVRPVTPLVVQDGSGVFQLARFALKFDVLSLGKILAKEV